MNVLVLSTAPTDACTYYRALQPLRRLRQHHGVRWTMTREINSAKLLEYDAIVMIRPTMPEHLEIAQRAKNLGLVLWSDFDDDIFDVPYYNSAWKQHSTDISKNITGRVCQISDHVTVTTESLKRKMKHYTGVECKIIPNVIDDYLNPKPVEPSPENAPVIAWRGGESHMNDLQAYKEAFIILQKRHGFRFVFMGMRPIPLKKDLIVGQWSHMETTEYVDGLYRNLKFINAPIHIVPLAQDALNESKSNLAWLEATWFGGSTVVCPKDWNESGQAGYSDQEEFIAQVVSLYENKGTRKSMWVDSVNTINEKYLLSKHLGSYLECLK